MEIEKTTAEPALKAQDKKIFVSKALGVSFELPRHISDCTEEENDAHDTKLPNGKEGQGWSLELQCDDYNIHIRATSRDFKCYEYCPTPKYNLELLRKNFPNEYILSGTEVPPLSVFAMDTRWGYGGETFELGAYYPLQGERYETFSISMTLAETIKEGIRDQNMIYDHNAYEDFTEDYLQRILNKELPEKELQKIADFENMLLSIEKL